MCLENHEILYQVVTNQFECTDSEVLKVPVQWGLINYFFLTKIPSDLMLSLSTKIKKKNLITLIGDTDRQMDGWMDR